MQIWCYMYTYICLQTAYPQPTTSYGIRVTFAMSPSLVTLFVKFLSRGSLVILRHLTRGLLVSNQSMYMHRLPIVAQIHMQEQGTDPKDFTGRGEARMHIALEGSIFFHTLRYFVDSTLYDSSGRYSL
jgi:hypothetical protein